jgi:hypothetical protein
MLYREITAACSQIHTKHINASCGQNVECLYVGSGGAESNQWAWWVKIEKTHNFSFVQFHMQRHRQCCSTWLVTSHPNQLKNIDSTSTQLTALRNSWLSIVAYWSTAIYRFQAGQTRICSRLVCRTHNSTERSILTRVDGNAYRATKHVNFAVFLEHQAMDKVQKPSSFWMKQRSLCQRDYDKYGLVRYGSHYVAWPSRPHWSILHSAFPRPSILIS